MTADDRARLSHDRRACCRCSAISRQHPDGVRADDVAQVVGKSGSTAYYLLASLVEEGFATHEGGLYRPRRARARAPAARRRRPRARPTPVDDLFLRTHKRCYLGVVRTGAIEIAVVRGRQGIAKMPGLGTQITRQRARAGDGQGRARAAATRRARPATPTAGCSATRARRSSRSKALDVGARRVSATTASRSTARSSTRTSAASRRPSSTTRGRLAADPRI